MTYTKLQLLFLHICWIDPEAAVDSLLCLRLVVYFHWPASLSVVCVHLSPLQRHSSLVTAELTHTQRQRRLTACTNSRQCNLQALTQQKPLKHLFNLIIRRNKTLTDGRYGMQIYLYICTQKYTMTLKKQLSLFTQWKTQLLLRRKII